MYRILIAVSVFLTLVISARATPSVPPDPANNPARGVRTTVNSCQSDIVVHIIGDDEHRWGENRALGAFINPSTREALTVDRHGHLRYVTASGRFVVFDRDCDVVRGDPNDLDFPAPPAVDPPPGVLCQSGSDNDSGGGTGSEGGTGTGEVCGGFADLMFGIDLSATTNDFGGGSYYDAEQGTYLFEMGQVLNEDTGNHVGAVMGVVELPVGICASEALGSFADLEGSEVSPFVPFGAPDDPHIASMFDTGIGSLDDIINGITNDTGWAPPVMALSWEGYAADPDDLVEEGRDLAAAIVAGTGVAIGAIATVGVFLASAPAAVYGPAMPAAMEAARKGAAVRFAALDAAFGTAVSAGIRIFSNTLADAGLKLGDTIYSATHDDPEECGSAASCHGALGYNHGLGLHRECGSLSGCTIDALERCFKSPECKRGYDAGARGSSDMPIPEFEDVPEGYDGFTDPGGNPLDPNVIGGDIDWGDDNPMVDGNPAEQFLHYSWMPIFSELPEWVSQPIPDEDENVDACFNPFYSPTLPGSATDCEPGYSPHPILGVCVQDGCIIEIVCDGTDCVPVHNCDGGTGGGETDPTEDPVPPDNPPDPCGGAC